MIRLLGNHNTARRPSRRRRVSNQLAAFAAIMLFASTQAPLSNETTVAHPGDDVTAVAALADGSQADGDDALETRFTAGAGGSAPVPARRRGLDLSLFLFGR